MSEPPQKFVAVSMTRQCPTTNGVHEPLIAHNLAVGACLKRQRGFYHKCHRCLYRGRAASYVIEEPAAKKG